MPFPLGVLIEYPEDRQKWTSLQQSLQPRTTSKGLKMCKSNRHPMDLKEQEHFLTFSIECRLEETKVESSSKEAFEQAPCRRTTFCTASKWETYTAREEFIFFFISWTACISDYFDVEIECKK